ncbi:hypothetical protein BT96DRAFT_923492 [Gymnopus androsaceus JB14]|uniref:Uncharacterized protein n=1 Tax=Gymnopus androsaceus JB14 TaxID=1447944 RepID=A0A6A4HA13_9AGAR|nr:hypothetical protein BT96DRAFT_923492 [Gymnopus androsaceus JB14]
MPNNPNSESEQTDKHLAIEELGSLCICERCGAGRCGTERAQGVEIPESSFTFIRITSSRRTPKCTFGFNFTGPLP